jgi:hypothetical protein
MKKIGNVVVEKVPNGSLNTLKTPNKSGWFILFFYFILF